MNVMGLILTISVYPFVAIMFFILKNELAPKHGIYCGVRLTKENAQTPEAERIIADCGRAMKRDFVVLMLAPLPMLLIPWFSIFFTVWMLWLIVGIFIFFIPYIRANKRLKALKLEKGWKKESTCRIAAEIKNAGKIRKVKWYHFAPPCLFSVVLFAVSLARFARADEPMFGVMTGTFAAITFLFWGIAVWMDRQNTQVISMDSAVNLNYARAKKNLWKKLWVGCAWLNTAYLAGLLFSFDKELRMTGLFWWISAVYIIVTIVLLVWILKAKKRLEAAYFADGELVETDDDDYWIWGLFYCNPADGHAMVEKRVGVGTTMNYGTPKGKLAGLLLGLLGGIGILSLPCICVWVILLEFVPIKLSVEDGRLIASQIRVDYSLPAGSIQDITLLEELPRLERVSGTSMDELKKGNYRIAEVGRCQVFLNPQNSIFIRLEAGGTVYYLSGFDDAQTLEVYKALTE